MRNPLLACALLLPLTGCASLDMPHPKPAMVDVPAAWSGAPSVALAARAPDSMAQWWQRFNDPLLAELVTDALQSNTSVQSAIAALRQARSLNDAARAGLFPTLNAGASAQSSESGHRAAVNDFGVNLDAGWELDLFGANRSSMHITTALAQASAATLNDVQTSIAAEVALNYIGLRSAQARLAIAADNLASQEDTLQITQWRLQAGLVTSLEAEQARAAAEQTRAQLPLLQSTQEQARHALSVLTGRAPTALTDLLSSINPVPQAADDLVLNIPAEVLRQRPDVRFAERQVAAALARVAQAQAVRAPDFALAGSLGLNAATTGGLSSSAALIKSVLASVTMPVFDGGARRAQVRAQRAALSQAESAYEAAVLLSLQEVEDSLATLRADRERQLRLQQASEAAGNAALLARQRFTSGLTDFQTVLETQRTQFSTQDSLAGAGADLSSDQVRLYKALGGAWQ